jgi:transcriptional regulator with XRE-family HTH domain
VRRPRRSRASRQLHPAGRSGCFRDPLRRTIETQGGSLRRPKRAMWRISQLSDRSRFNNLTLGKATIASLSGWFRAIPRIIFEGTGPLTVTASQIKKARALLAWSQDDIGIACGVDTLTIVNLESGKQSAAPATLEAICATLEAAGAEFSDVDAQAVKLRKPQNRFRLERTQAKDSKVGTAAGERYFDYLLSEFAIP